MTETRETYTARATDPTDPADLHASLMASDPDYATRYAHILDDTRGERLALGKRLLMVHREGPAFDDRVEQEELIAAQSDRIAAGEWIDLVQDATVEDRDRTIEDLRRKYQDAYTRIAELEFKLMTGGKK
jgi:hypothetical protein